jgi:L-lactate dehydrogenase complex protein LldF
VLIHLRARAVEAKRAKRHLPTLERIVMKISSTVLSSPRLLGAAQKAAHLGGRVLSHDGTIGPLPGPGRAWSDARDCPVPARESFRAWWADRDGKDRP